MMCDIGAGVLGFKRAGDCSVCSVAFKFPVVCDLGMFGLLSVECLKFVEDLVGMFLKGGVVEQTLLVE